MQPNSSVSSVPDGSASTTEMGPSHDECSATSPAPAAGVVDAAMLSTFGSTAEDRDIEFNDFIQTANESVDQLREREKALAVLCVAQNHTECKFSYDCEYKNTTRTQDVTLSGRIKDKDTCTGIEAGAREAALRIAYSGVPSIVKASREIESAVPGPTSASAAEIDKATFSAAALQTGYFDDRGVNLLRRFRTVQGEIQRCRCDRTNVFAPSSAQASHDDTAQATCLPASQTGSHQGQEPTVDLSTATGRTAYFIDHISSIPERQMPLAKLRRMNQAFRELGKRDNHWRCDSGKCTLPVEEQMSRDYSRFSISRALGRCQGFVSIDGSNGTDISARHWCFRGAYDMLPSLQDRYRVIDEQRRATSINEREASNKTEMRQWKQVASESGFFDDRGAHLKQRAQAIKDLIANREAKGRA